MSTIDKRVVEAQFDNKQFESGVRETISSMDRLKRSLAMTGVRDGLDHVTRGINVMRVAAVTALATIAHQATIAAERFIKAFTFGPIIDGFKEYETKLGSTQTILANTARYGTKLADVNKALNQLNHYADKTIYNFGDMTKNIGLFTNAGIRIEDATSMIKGFSNAAAASGTNAEGAAHAAYQLSQALSTGTIRLMDWRSLTNVGMGNKNMQQGLIDLADAMGTVEAHGVTAKGIQKNFNQSLQEGWLTTKVMSSYLKIMAGDMTAAQMKHVGLTDAQVKNFQKTQKTAEEAATKVRSLTQLLSTMKEAVGSGWSATFELLFGNFNQATKLFTNVNNVLGGFINHSAKARNKLLQHWKDMGGRKVLIEALGNAFKALTQMMGTVRDGFREIFPKMTADRLFELTEHFRDFTESLKMGGDTADKLKRTFAGVFAIFSIAGQIISGFISGIRALFDELGGTGKAAGGLLDVSSGLGDFLVNLSKTLKQGGQITSFFHTLASVLAVPLKLLSGLAQMLGGLFSGFDHHGANQVSGALDSINGKMGGLTAVGNGLLHFFTRIGEALGNLGRTIGEALSNIGDAIANSIKPGSFDKAVAVVNTGLLGAITLMIHSFLKGDKSIKVDFGGGLLENMKETASAATGMMKAMQTQIKAEAIMKIAIALGILTASILVLSMIDGKKLAKALVGVSIGFAGFQVSLAALTKTITYMGAAKLPLIAIGLMGLGVAMLLFTGAIALMSTIDFKDMLKGLLGMAVALDIVRASMERMPKNPLLVAQAAALVLFGVGLNVVAMALKIFATFSWDDMAHGLVAMAGALTVIAAAMNAMPKTMALQAAGLTVLGVGLNLIASAMKIFGTMDYGATAKGLVVMAGALMVINDGMRVMPKTMVVQAAGLLAVSVALNIIAAAMKILGTMGWEEIARGLTALAGAMAILAGGLYLMEGALPGAAALLVAAGALAIFTPILITLGNLDWTTIAKGLGALAAAFAVLGLAGVLLEGAAPGLLAFGAAMLMFGAGVALVGVGVLALATGFGILVATMTSGAATIAQIVQMWIMSIPKAFEALGVGIVHLAMEIAKGQVAFTKAFLAIFTAIIDALVQVIPKIVGLVIKLMDMLLNAIIKDAPKIQKAFEALFDLLIAVVVKGVPKIVGAAYDMMIGFLNKIADKIPDVAKAAADVIIAFITALGDQALNIGIAAAQTLITFLNGLAAAIRIYEPQLMEAGWNIAKAIVAGFWDGLKGGLGGMFGKVKDVFGPLEPFAMKVLEAQSPSRVFMRIGRYVTDGFALGLEGGRQDVKDAWTHIHDILHDAVQKTKDDIDDYKSQLKDLNEHPKKNAAEIEKLTAKLEKSRKELELGRGALTLLNDKYDKQHAHLVRLGKQYDVFTERIDKANQKLRDAIQLRNDFRAQTTDQYDNIPDITAETKLPDYVTDFEKQVIDTQSFADVMAKLRDKYHLDDTIYKELIGKGPDILPFVEQILAGGQKSVNQLNALDSQLAKEAKALGATASAELYQAGVDSAQGFVNGLKRQRAAIAAEMRHIAHVLVVALKDELKIKSPSKVFDELGNFTGRGLAIGLTRSIPYVEKATAALGTNTLETMRRSISDMHRLLAIEPDMNPTITPVLDLSVVQKQATGLAGMLAANAISVDAAYSKATNASYGYQSNVDAALAAQVQPESTPGSVTFIQNNNSPKALSPADIYRQTNNQLSTLKGALASNNAT